MRHYRISEDVSDRLYTFTCRTGDDYIQVYHHSPPCHSLDEPDHITAYYVILKWFVDSTIQKLQSLLSKGKIFLKNKDRKLRDLHLIFDSSNV